MSERKVVQIHRIIGPENNKWQGRLITTAVCEDGTVWEQIDDGEWNKLPSIPSRYSMPSVWGS